jgi:hypothetical protein
MKQNTFALLAFIITILYACQPAATFIEPQPIGTDNLIKFPNRLHGTYISLEDSTLLSINDKSIHKIYNFTYTIHKNELDNTSKIVGDSIINPINNKKSAFKVQGDSLAIDIHQIDTLFHLDKDHILRKFKGYYFLNSHYNNSSWELKKLQLTKGKISISKISKGTDLDMLRGIAEHPEDTISLIKLAPTKRQFKKFVKNRGFSDSEDYVKLE